MANVIKPKRSSTSSSVPTTSDLADGEIAVNTADQKIYMRSGSNIITVADTAAAASGLSNVVEDTTPQLGGDLDTNGNNITFGDNDKAIFGAGTDLEIYHDGSNSYITDSGTGNLKIGGDNVEITTASGTKYFEGSSNIARLYNSGNQKLSTHTSGIVVTGNIILSGTVDGRNVANDGSKLDNIEGSATYNPNAIDNVSEDTTPQLGGNLDLNSNNITGTGNISTTGNFTLTSTDDGSSAAPEIDLVRNSASPADSDYLGQIKFTGENDAGQSVLYAKITGKAPDVSDTTEDGLIEYAVKKAGTNTIVSRLTGTALKLINGTGLEVAGNITVDGTVDGRDVATDGSKLDGIEASADVTDTTNVVAALTAGTNVTIAADGTISSTDTNTTYSVGDGGLTQNNFTDALKTKLDGIEASADVTPSWVPSSDPSYITGLAFNDLSSKDAGTGDYSTNGDLVSGRGSGGVALTINDGYGNANVTFNHRNGTPEQNGQSARIEVNTDATSNEATMYFEFSASDVTADTAVGLTTGMTLAHDYVEIPNRIRHAGDNDTYIQFDTDRIRLYAGNTAKIDTDVSYAPLASPTFTGTPAAPTASTGTNTTQLATTAFVQQEITALKALLYAYDQS